MTALAIAAALASALCFAAAFVSQQHVAAAVPEDQGRGLRLYRQLAKSPLWWAGFLGDTGGFGFQAVALAFGSIVLVQPFLVTALVFALPIAARWNGRKIGRVELGWAVAVVAALGLFMVLASPTSGNKDPSFDSWIGPGAVTLVLIAVTLVISWRTRGPLRALALGSATGLCYGLVAALTDVVVHLFTDGGLLAVLGSWEMYVLAVAAFGGTALQQMAFHAGALSASLPATQVLEPVTGSILGVTVLGASLSAHGPAWIGVAAAVVVMIVGTVVLARNAVRPIGLDGSIT